MSVRPACLTLPASFFADLSVSRRLSASRRFGIVLSIATHLASYPRSHPCSLATATLTHFNLAVPCDLLPQPVPTLVLLLHLICVILAASLPIRSLSSRSPSRSSACTRPLRHVTHPTRLYTTYPAQCRSLIIPTPYLSLHSTSVRPNGCTRPLRPVVYFNPSSHFDFNPSLHLNLNPRGPLVAPLPLCCRPSFALVTLNLRSALTLMLVVLVPPHHFRYTSPAELLSSVLYRSCSSPSPYATAYTRETLTLTQTPL